MRFPGVALLITRPFILRPALVYKVWKGLSELPIATPPAVLGSSRVFISTTGVASIAASPFGPVGP